MLNTNKYLVDMGISLWQAIAYIRLVWDFEIGLTISQPHDVSFLYEYIFDRDRQGISGAKTKTKTMQISNDKIK